MLDAHCHIDFYSDPLDIAMESERCRITTIAMTNLPSHYQAAYPHVKNLKYIRLALGLHPLLAEQHQEETSIFKQLLPKVSYIGEVGLDFSKEGSATRQKQIKCLRFVFSNIKDRQRFLSIHSRGAANDVLELLEEFSIKKAVFHWYSGSLSILDQALRSGHYFSVNIAMIRSTKGRKIIERIPRDRILTETDGPFIKVQSRPIKPIDARSVLIYLADVWCLSLSEAEMQVESAFKAMME